MDKIKIRIGKKDWSLVDVYDKLDELVEGYNEMMERLDANGQWISEHHTNYKVLVDRLDKTIKNYREIGQSYR